MPLNPIASIKQVYQSIPAIPGKTAYNKTTFLGQKALEILPAIAIGYSLRNHVSSDMVIQGIEVLPFFAKDLKNPLHSRILLSFGIGLEARNCIDAAKMFRNASTPTDRFAFFCIAYAAAYCAGSYFSSLYKEPDNTEIQQSTVYSPLVDCALKCIALPFQFKYRPIETITGLGVGAFFGKNDFSNFINSLKKGKFQGIDDILASLSEAAREFSTSLPTKTTVITKIWNEWNRVILAVASPIQAFNSSLYQGKELFSSSGKTLDID